MTRTIDRRRDMGGGKATRKSERDRAAACGGGALRATGTEHPSSALDGNRWVALSNATLVGFMSRRPRRRRRIRSSRASPRPVAAMPVVAAVRPRRRWLLLRAQRTSHSPQLCFTNHAKKATMHAPIVMRSATNTSGPTVAHPSPPTAVARRIRSGVATAFAYRHASATCHPTTASPFGRRTAGERIDNKAIARAGGVGRSLRQGLDRAGPGTGAIASKPTLR